MTRVYTRCVGGKVMIVEVRWLRGERGFTHGHALNLDEHVFAADPLESAFCMWVFHLRGVAINLAGSDPRVSRELHEMCDVAAEHLEAIVWEVAPR